MPNTTYPWGSITIDGTSIKTQEYTVDIESLASEDSGRTDSGKMEIEWVYNRLRKVSVKLPPMSQTDLAPLLDKVMGKTFSMYYVDPIKGETSGQFYCSNCSQGLWYNGWFQGATFSCIEIEGESTGGGGGTYQEKTVTPTTSQQVITADSGYDALSRVTVNATPLESKSITSNGTYTPSGSNIGFSRVNVNVSSGGTTVTSLSATENRTYTAPSGYAYSPVYVNVEPSLYSYGTITTNGTYNIPSGYDGLDSLIVNVASSGVYKFTSTGVTMTAPSAAGNTTTTCTVTVDGVSKTPRFVVGHFTLYRSVMPSANAQIIVCAYYIGSASKKCYYANIVFAGSGAQVLAKATDDTSTVSLSDKQLTFKLYYNSSNSSYPLGATYNGGWAMYED